MTSTIKVQIAETFDQDLTAYIESLSPDLLKPDAVITEAQGKISNLEAHLNQLLESTATIHAQRQPLATPTTLSSYTATAVATMGKVEAKRLNDLAVIDGQLALLEGEENKLSAQIEELKQTIQGREAEREAELERLTKRFIGKLVNDRSRELSWLINHKAVPISAMLPYWSGGHWWSSGHDQPVFTQHKPLDGHEWDED
jgi:phage shock protein A